MSLITSFWELHGEKIISVAKGAAIAAAGAGLDYGLHYVTSIPIDPNYVPLEVAGLSILVQFIRKLGIPITKFIIAGKEV